MAHQAAAQSTDSVSVQDGLRRAYRVWLHSRRQADEVTDLLTAAGVDASKAAVVLENALMHLLIDDGVADPVALWPRVDGAACAVGLREVGVGDPGLAERLAQALRRPLSGPPAPEALEPRILPDRLQVGAFELVRNGWVDKAWWHVASLRGPDAATVAVLRAALRYAALFSETRHIGPPQSVYDDFYAWGVRNEGFASPFNARLLGKPGTRFFSACADVDAPFGSAGSFFGHADPAMPGAWCLDPPFLTRTIRQVEARIAQWRRTPNPPTV